MSGGYVPVPRLWPGETVVCIASGPSLTDADVEFVRSKARVIVVNTTYLKAPWADCLYACDGIWWRWHHGVPTFTGLKYGMGPSVGRVPGVTVLRNMGERGLESDPTGLRTGLNSGYQAINLAVHFGASRIVLLGYDLQVGPNGQEHWHKNHPSHRQNPYRLFLRNFPTLVEPLKAIGVDVVNCTRRTALTCFPQASLQEVFA